MKYILVLGLLSPFSHSLSAEISRDGSWPPVFCLKPYVIKDVECKESLVICKYLLHLTSSWVEGASYQKKIEKGYSFLNDFDYKKGHACFKGLYVLKKDGCYSYFDKIVHPLAPMLSGIAYLLRGRTEKAYSFIEQVYRQSDQKLSEEIFSAETEFWKHIESASLYFLDILNFRILTNFSFLKTEIWS